MMQIVLVGLGAGAAAALLFASVASGSMAGDLPVLSRAAADPDRRARLEPLGGADRGGLGDGGASAFCPASSSSRSCSGSPSGVVARLSRAAGAPGRERRRHRPRMVSGRPPRAVGGDHRHADRGRRHCPISAPTRQASQAGLRKTLDAGAACLRDPALDRPCWSICWCCRRPRPCSPPSPTCATSGSPPGS